MKEFMEKLEADKKAQEKAEVKAAKEDKKDVKEEISIEDFTKVEFKSRDNYFCRKTSKSRSFVSRTD